MERNVIIFVADLSICVSGTSVHIDDKNKYILIGPTQGLDDVPLTAETKYPNDFIQPNKRFVLSLLYNGSNSFLIVNTPKMCQFKEKDSEIKDYTLCLGNISKVVTINSMKKAVLKGIVQFIFVDFNAIYTDNVLDIPRYLMKEK